MISYSQNKIGSLDEQQISLNIRTDEFVLSEEERMIFRYYWDWNSSNWMKISQQNIISLTPGFLNETISIILCPIRIDSFLYYTGEVKNDIRPELPFKKRTQNVLLLKNDIRPELPFSSKIVQEKVTLYSSSYQY